MKMMKTTMKMMMKKMKMARLPVMMMILLPLMTILQAAGALVTTPYPGYGLVTTPYMSFYDNYLGVNVLTGPAPVTVKTSPKTKTDVLTRIKWPASKSRPYVTYTLCDYVSIKTVSFHTTNVKSAGIIVDSSSYYGTVNADKNVEIRTSNDKNYKRVGSVVKITLTPINYAQPVAIDNVAIYSWGLSDDCFVDCAVYVLETDSGCMKPLCFADPCEDLGCTDDMECRLVLHNNTMYLPDLMAYRAQVWECVDISRTDYGCKCNSYQLDENKCPSCTCI